MARAVGLAARWQPGGMPLSIKELSSLMTNSRGSVPRHLGRERFAAAWVLRGGGDWALDP